MEFVAFAAYKAERDRLIAAMRAATQTMNELKAGHAGPMGLTPDHIKFSAPYRAAKREYDLAHAAMAKLSSANLKRFAKALRAERDAARNRYRVQVTAIASEDAPGIDLGTTEIEAASEALAIGIARETLWDARLDITCSPRYAVELLA